VEEQAFKLTGIRGAGKTVTLTAIEREIKADDSWIVVDLKSNSDLMQDLVSTLYSENSLVTKYVDASLNLSAFGIGLNLSKKSPITSLDVALKEIVKEISKKEKRVLITIDEVRKTDSLVNFIQEFQILIRDELPIYLIVAGLYEDIESVENTEGLTFFLRAEKHEMSPLSINIIRESYKQTLNLSHDTAQELAKMTKGYAFAYQAFGMYMWDSHGKEITDMVLAQVDYALAEKVYNKIWSELTPTDKWYLQYIVKKDDMQVSEMLEEAKKKHSEWSVSRKRLMEKGVIDGSVRGRVSCRLPRFKEYVESRM
ncbi:MAG: hypothetical protein II915_00645, partial [Eubacterium sp.]|nr:hypothetical protein [Eubacterium sp.]